MIEEFQLRENDIERNGHIYCRVCGERVDGDIIKLPFTTFQPSLYISDLSKCCIHIVDALFHWGHAESALFTLQEFEEEAHRHGFRTINKKNDLGLQGYFHFKK